MAQKPEIQYVGQFYIHGSEAKKLAENIEQKKAKKELPAQNIKTVRKVYVDSLAIASLCAALVLMATMVVGVLSLQTARQELHIARQYAYELQEKNRELSVAYHSSYDLEAVEAAALEMGLIPVAEAKTMNLRVTVPVKAPEPTLLDDVVWFMKGLFE